MIVRNEQMKVLGDRFFDAFVSRMTVHLRLACTSETQHLDDDALRTLVRAGVEKASKFQIYEEDNLVTFLETATLYGLDFCDAPVFKGARQILENQRIAETEKMNCINEYLIFAQ